jgi:undecaprenyl-diphosphatase
VTTLQSLLLGALQGATEFLPVSSSGHLYLAQRLLGIREAELAFDTLLHLGTLAAVVFFLRGEIASIARSLLSPRRGFGTAPLWGAREGWLVAAATVPTVVLALLFKPYVEAGVSALGVGLRYLVLTGLLLLSARPLRHKWDPSKIYAWEALLVGAVQGMAVFPGLSRSGSTVSTALLLGLEAERAVRFSFLLSLPAIGGAALLNLRGDALATLPPFLPSAVGLAASAVTGYLALLLVEALVERGNFRAFAPYTAAMAALAFFLHFRG